MGRGPVTGERSWDWRAVLFDLDGTLADTVPLILLCYRHTMMRHLGRDLPDELWIRKIGLPLRVSMAEFTADPAEVERMITTYSEFQKTVHDDMVGSFPYALDTLSALRSRGVLVGVVTSKGREMAGRTLACCGLVDWDVLVTVDDVVHGKPDPEPFLVACRRLAVDPAACVVFEDSEAGLRAARAAGTTVVFVRHCAVDAKRLEPLADVAIDDFTDLDPKRWTQP